jgi:DNA-3-methyladenine glycosylase II
MERTITSLTPVPPYDFELTAAQAAYFKTNTGADWFHDGVFRRLLDLGNRLCLVKVRSLNKMDSPGLEVELNGTGLDDTVVSRVRHQVARLLGIHQELTPFYRMALEDPALSPLVQGLWGLHIPQTVYVWEALVLAILGQQVNSHMARILRNLIVKSYGRSLEDSGVTYHAFPKPEALMEAGLEGLQSIKLSKRKSQYIVDIATALASREQDLENLRNLSDQEVIRTATGMRGVGLWTAHWLLIRALTRPDVFPHGDLALRRTMGRLLKQDRFSHPEEALMYSMRWSPYRSYVTTYLFAATRSGRFPELSRTG